MAGASGPEHLPGVWFPEHRGQRFVRCGAPDDDVERVGEAQDAREVPVPTIRVEEPRWSRTSDASEEDVQHAELVKGVERVERLEAGEVALADAARQGAVFAPLHVYPGRAPMSPVGVQYLAVPVRPDVGRCATRIVSHPDDL